jgi:hypothetical protein
VRRSKDTWRCATGALHRYGLTVSSFRSQFFSRNKIQSEQLDNRKRRLVGLLTEIKNTTTYKLKHVFRTDSDKPIELFASRECLRTDPPHVRLGAKFRRMIIKTSVNKVAMHRE